MRVNNGGSEMLERTGDSNDGKVFAWKRGSKRARFCQSRRNERGRFRRWHECCGYSGGGGFQKRVDAIWWLRCGGKWC